MPKSAKSVNISHEKFTHWAERGLLQLFLKLQTRQNLHFNAEMFSSVAGYWYGPDTGQHTIITML